MNSFFMMIEESLPTGGFFSLTYLYLLSLPPPPNSDKSDPSALEDRLPFYICPQSSDLLLGWFLLSSSLFQRVTSAKISFATYVSQEVACYLKTGPL